jgi:hypothetical protein
MLCRFPQCLGFPVIRCRFFDAGSMHCVHASATEEAARTSPQD